MEWILADPTHETSVGHKRRGYSTAAASPILLKQYFFYIVNCICLRVAECISHHSVGGKKALEMPKWNKSRLFLLKRPLFYIKGGFALVSRAMFHGIYICILYIPFVPSAYMRLGVTDFHQPGKWYWKNHFTKCLTKLSLTWQKSYSGLEHIKVSTNMAW